MFDAIWVARMRGLCLFLTCLGGVAAVVAKFYTQWTTLGLCVCGSCVVVVGTLGRQLPSPNPAINQAAVTASMRPPPMPKDLL